MLGQAGYNNYLRAGLLYPQAFITVHKNIILNPAYIFFVQKHERSRKSVEHYLMNSIILQATGKNFLLEDRNMLWDRFNVGSGARHYYRNRLKITQSFKIREATIKVYAYDEIFYLFNENNLTRNRIALGTNCVFIVHLNVDIAWVRQWDKHSGNLNLFFIMGIWQFGK